MDSKNLIINDENEEIDFKQIYSFLKRRKKNISIITLGGFLISAFYLIFRNPLWEGHFQIVLTNPESGSSGGINNFLSQNRNLSNLIGINSGGNEINTEITILKSPLVLRPVFEFVKKERVKNGKSIEGFNFRGWQRNNLDISLEKDTSVLNLYYRDHNKKLILPVLNLISNDYQDYSGRNRRIGIDNGLNYLKDQVSLYKVKSINSLKRLEEYGIKNKISLINSDSSILKSSSSFEAIQSFGDIRSNKSFLTDVEEGRDIALSKIRNIQSQIKSLNGLKVGQNDKEILYFGIKNQVVDKNKLIDEIAKNEIKLSLAKTNFLPKDVLLKQLEMRREVLIDTLKLQTSGLLKGQLIDAKDKLKIYERPQNVIFEYKQLYRDSQLNERTLGKLESELQQLLLEKSKYEKPWELISNPYLLEKPVGLSKSRVILTGTFLGFLLGLLISFIKDKTSNLVYSKKEFEKLIDYPFLITIPTTNNSSFDEYIDILINTDLFINIDKNNYCLIAPSNDGDVNPLFKNFAEKLKRSLSPKDIKLCKKLSDANQYSNKILLFTSGNLSKIELKKVINSLNLQNGNVLGWIYFDNELDKFKVSNLDKS